MSLSTEHLRRALANAPEHPRHYGIPRGRPEYRDPPPLSWLTRADPMTKLAIAIAAVASVFCVGASVMLAVGRAFL